MNPLFQASGRALIPPALRAPVYGPLDVAEKPIKRYSHKYMDNTRISDYRTCPRYYYYRHIRDWRPALASLALINGSCWHEAMNTIWQFAGDKSIPDMALLRLAFKAYCDLWKKEGLKDPEKMTPDEVDAINPRGPFVAKEVMWNYILKRRSMIQDGVVIDIERPFAIPLIVEDGETLVYYVGRLDKVFKSNQYGKLVIEHKTTSWYATNGFFRAEWVDSFSPNSQVDGYLFSAHAIYGEIRGVWVDGALFHKKVFDGIKFIPIDRQFSMIDSWLGETYSWLERIENDSRTLAETGELERSFTKNTGSCGNYGGCTYRDVCRFVVDPHKLKDPPNGFKVDPWNPFDVLKLEKIAMEPEDGKQKIENTVETVAEKKDESTATLDVEVPTATVPRIIQVFEDETTTGTWWAMFSDGTKREVLITEFEMTDPNEDDWISSGWLFGSQEEYEEMVQITHYNDYVPSWYEMSDGQGPVTLETLLHG